MDAKLMKHGAFSWFELMTTDVKTAKDFYGKLFDWNMKDIPMGHMDYTVVKVHDEEVAGIMPMPANAKDMPPVWGIYFTVDNMAVTIAKAKELKGKILVEPKDIPDIGQFCVIQDPQGAWFTVIEYKR
jgi:predicted enzyme related to lactoylglutathione lyase